MELTRAQKKAKLNQAVEAAIEQLLDWDAAHSAPNLSQIEEVILALRQRLGQAMAEVVTEGQEAQQPAESPPCPSCGEGMRYRGRKRKAVESRVGELVIERGHYTCARCGSGFFPLGPATGGGGAGVE